MLIHSLKYNIIKLSVGGQGGVKKYVYGWPAIYENTVM